MTFYEWKETLANDTSLFSLEEQAWNHQQERIDALKKENSKLAEAAIIPEGYVLVPVEPTEKMVDAFWSAVEVGNEAKLIDVFTAMINAAQDEEPEV